MSDPITLSSLIDRIRSAGATADRWTSPDLLGQLHLCLKRPVDTIICSTLDFDDVLPLQQTVATDQAAELVGAVSALAAATGANRAFVVVDAVSGGKCGRAVERVDEKSSARTVALQNNYPQANPTLLLHHVARRHLRPGHLPPEAGVVVLDAVAAVAVGRCLVHNEPQTQVSIGLADLRGEKPQTHLLRIAAGTPVGDALRQAGVAGAMEIRAGSPLREIRIETDAVITAGGEVAIYVVAPQPHVIPAPCIRCGWCVSSCPVHINPAGILQAAQSENHASAERYGLDSCIECGVCSYVCPSHLPLLGGIRALRENHVAGAGQL